MTIGFKLIYFILFIYILFNQIEAYEKKYYISSKSIKVIKNDLPSRTDLPVYLAVLKRIIGYCSRTTNILSYNLVFGLFLINVNLESFVKNGTLPVSIRSDLKHLLTKSSELHDYYNYKVQRKDTDYDNMQKAIAILCANATAWSRRVAETKLNLDLLRKPYTSVVYPKWSRYQSALEDIDKGMPNPNLSNQCVKSLARNKENHSKYLVQCEIQKECLEAIFFGSDFGYSLNHRLIILQLAGFSRRCVIFSSQKDELLKLSLCEKVYLDTKYNVLHGFKIVDLIFEQIALCTLDGHAQFLRRSWLSHLLEDQNTTGCFQISRATNECNDHVMAVAAGTYAAAARFILENH